MQSDSKKEINKTENCALSWRANQAAPSRNWNEFKRNKFNLELQVALIFWKSAQGLPHKAVQSSVWTKNYASLTKADVVELFSLLFWLIFS